MKSLQFILFEITVMSISISNCLIAKFVLVDSYSNLLPSQRLYCFLGFCFVVVTFFSYLFWALGYGVCGGLWLGDHIWVWLLCFKLMQISIKTIYENFTLSSMDGLHLSFSSLSSFLLFLLTIKNCRNHETMGTILSNKISYFHLSFSWK